MEGIAKKAKVTRLATSYKYHYEEICSDYGYSKYKFPKSLNKQIRLLKKFFPSLGNNPTVGKFEGFLPNVFEGWFAIPNIWRSEPVLPGSYHEQVIGLFELLKKSRGELRFLNYNSLGEKNAMFSLKELDYSKNALQELSKDQKDPDILVIPAQFGLQHKGRSLRRAYEVMLDKGQFPLGLFAGGVMLLTHPGRLQDIEDLEVACAGDEFYDPNLKDLVFSFRFNNGGILLSLQWTGIVCVYSGSISGFVSQ